jgi:hypothetical protein
MFFKGKKNLLTENEKMKNQLVKDINTLIFTIETKKYLGTFTDKTIDEVLKLLKEASSNLDSAIFTGNEDIKNVFDNSLKAIKEFKVQLNSDSDNTLLVKAKEIIDSSSKIKMIAEGQLADDIDDVDIKKEGHSIAKKRASVNSKLKELYEIKNDLLMFDKSLEKQIKLHEVEKEELEEKMISEENERILNELDRKITSLESIIESLNVNRSNYSASFDLLHNIYSRIKPLVENDSTLSSDNLDTANALLKINALKEVLNKPDKVLVILRNMNEDSQKIVSNVQKIDGKIYESIGVKQTTTTNDSALRRKEELLRKKREKELVKENLTELKSNDVADVVDETVEGEN